MPPACSGFCGNVAVSCLPPQHHVPCHDCSRSTCASHQQAIRPSCTSRTGDSDRESSFSGLFRTNSRFFPSPSGFTYPIRIYSAGDVLNAFQMFPSSGDSFPPRDNSGSGGDEGVCSLCDDTGVVLCGSCTGGKSQFRVLTIGGQSLSLQSTCSSCKGTQQTPCPACSDSSLPQSLPSGGSLNVLAQTRDANILASETPGVSGEIPPVGAVFVFLGEQQQVSA
mmetsp:Transcript_15550/g.25742  ORF Transcript_15550/g.25742 Transcript_15550/m.25742 type:complete len:223 (+) Transcript_15550:106-774(+)